MNLKNFLAWKGVHYFAARGPAWLRRRAFDAKFRSGVWDFSDHGELPAIVNDHCKDGALMILGVGAGSIIPQLSARSILGVDISAEGLAMARRYGQARQGVMLCQDDMDTMETDGEFDAILFHESIYYSRDAIALLVRLRDNLKPYTGVFIVTAYNLPHDSRLAQQIEQNFASIQHVGKVLVFSARRAPAQNPGFRGSLRKATA